MANLSVYEPFNSRMNRFISNFVNRPSYLQDMDTLASTTFKMDVSEDDKNYFVQADLPGYKKEDIHISVEGDQVTISAETRMKKEEKKGRNVIHSERFEGKAFRSFTLDYCVDENRSEARFADGVLELTLPKEMDASNCKQIKVQ